MDAHSAGDLAPWARAILHVDLDAFYAAVEVLDYPDLKGKPIIVGAPPEARGVVATASYEAREFGVHSAMPSARAERLCPNAVWRMPRMERYAEVSAQIRRIFLEFTDKVEPLSLDEAFLDITGSQRLLGPAPAIAAEVRRRIRERTGLTASAGLSYNLFLAKLASDMNKPDGLTILRREDLAAKVHPLPVRRLWGVGPKTQERLDAIGLRTIGDVFRCPDDLLASRLGRETAAHLKSLAAGADEREVTPDSEAKSIGREETFPSDIRDRDRMEACLLRYADEVAARLRGNGLQARCVHLKVRTGSFKTLTRACTLAEPTDMTDEIWRTACTLLREKVQLGGEGVRLLGVSTSGFVPAGPAQKTLFEDVGREKRRKAERAMDAIRRRFGAGSIRRATADDEDRDEEKK